MRYIGQQIQQEIESCILEFEHSQLNGLFGGVEPMAIKFVSSDWAAHYRRPRRLKISETPALTWGTATYVTPLAFPLSSVLYGRIGLVTPFQPTGWRIFDATTRRGRRAYRRWTRTQPAYSDLLLTVHSTHANHLLRNRFREAFRIDCVLFHPDQEAERYTEASQHIWMAVTDWGRSGIDCSLSNRLNQARFTVLVDEEFDLEDETLPIRLAPRKIEAATELLRPHVNVTITRALSNTSLPAMIASSYHNGGYMHVFIEP